jgi:hypothetical protein
MTVRIGVIGGSGLYKGGTRGVMVRLETSDADIAGPVEVTLTPTKGGDAVVLELLDDGQPPDVTADDGIYAASTITTADRFSVTVRIGGTEKAQEDVSWEADAAAARDLVIRLVDDEVSFSASMPAAEGVPGRERTKAERKKGDSSRKATKAARRRAEAGGFSRRDILLWLAIGLGVFGLGAAGLLIARWLSRRGESDLRPLPEPPFLGPKTPSLSDGLSLWVVHAADRETTIGPLLSSLAAQHRVLVVTEPETLLPPVFGGPVFRSKSTGLEDVEDTLYDLGEVGGAPLTVLLIANAPTLESVEAVADLLPAGVGGIAILPTALVTDFPALHWSVDGDRATLESATGTTHLRITSQGLGLA